ncbi:hypothetical protein PHYBOEH_006544 [Phytophthora boehmeriae]|uniref:Uncharacterized protein n=1 Tax=Phytophthora boehmeriae TaxID=109152 RepID=A0A8T1WIT3_9STRA|nr:hypothetical protein PHYBOEH_006544 [Phytophthora boehmeriae]
MESDESVRASGFKRILVRLDDNTRRKYCCRALEEDLCAVKTQMSACVDAMAEVRQVEDASRKLDAKNDARLRSDLLSELEALQLQLEKAATALFTLGGNADVKEEDSVQVDEDASKFQEAKALAKQILQTDNLEDIEGAVDKVKQLERLMPEVATVEDKRQRWWKKHVQKAIDHVLEIVTTDAKKFAKATTRLVRLAKKAASKCPSLTDWSESVEEAVATKSKKKRLIALPDDGESAFVSSSTPAKTTVSTSATDSNGGQTKKKTKETPSVEKTRSLLQRCSREVRTLRDKFDLGAYDVNLSRAVTIVDSVWPGFDHSELVALTTALFTLVETTEKIPNVSKRRDRLVCLESVLGVVLGNPKLSVSVRRKTMLEEYAKNCRQSLEQLSRPSENGKQPATSKVTAKTPSTTAASRSKNKIDRTAWPKAHVRFD